MPASILGDMSLTNQSFDKPPCEMDLLVTKMPCSFAQVTLALSACAFAFWARTHRRTLSFSLTHATHRWWPWAFSFWTVNGWRHIFIRVVTLSLVRHLRSLGAFTHGRSLSTAAHWRWTISFTFRTVRYRGRVVVIVVVSPLSFVRDRAFTHGGPFSTTTHWRTVALAFRLDGHIRRVLINVGSFPLVRHWGSLRTFTHWGSFSTTFAFVRRCQRRPLATGSLAFRRCAFSFRLAFSFALTFPIVICSGEGQLQVNAREKEKQIKE